jgi:AcrR family transcriptional regulator
LYYYYENKEAIFIDALEREISIFQKKVKETINDLNSYREKIIIFVKSAHDYFQNRTEMLDFDMQVMLENHTLIKKLSKEQSKKNIDLLADLLRKGIAEGQFKKMNENKLSHALKLVFSTLRMEMYQNLAGRRPTDQDFDELKSESLYILEIFLDGIQKD